MSMKGAQEGPRELRQITEKMTKCTIIMIVIGLSIFHEFTKSELQEREHSKNKSCESRRILIPPLPL